MSSTKIRATFNAVTSADLLPDGVLVEFLKALRDHDTTAMQSVFSAHGDKWINDIYTGIRENPVIMISLQSGYHRDALTVLLQHGADINAADNGGTTPLMHLATKDNPDIDHIDFFTDNGADLYVWPMNPTSIASLAEEKYPVVAAVLRKAEQNRMIEKLKQCANITVGNGGTVMFEKQIHAAKQRRKIK